MERLKGILTKKEISNLHFEKIFFLERYEELYWTGEVCEVVGTGNKLELIF